MTTMMSRSSPSPTLGRAAVLVPASGKDLRKLAAPSRRYSPARARCVWVCVDVSTTSHTKNAQTRDLRHESGKQSGSFDSLFFGWPLQYTLSESNFTVIRRKRPIRWARAQSRLCWLLLTVAPLHVSESCVGADHLHEFWSRIRLHPFIISLRSCANKSFHVSFCRYTVIVLGRGGRMPTTEI